MAFAAFSTISLLVFVLCLRSTYGDDGGWVTGHATFYGGGDASGTMGKYKSFPSCKTKLKKNKKMLGARKKLES